MSTRAIVGIEHYMDEGPPVTAAYEHPDGGSPITAVYVHYDGYFEGLGRELAEHWPSRADAERLVGMGDLRSVLDGEADAFEDGDPAVTVRSYSGVNQLVKDTTAEYAYIHGNEGVWRCAEYSVHDRCPVFGPLSGVVTP